MTPARPRAGDLRVVGMLVLTPLVTAYVVWQTWYTLSMDCIGYDDEGIIRAPRSWQGRLVCSDGGYGDPRVTTLCVLAVVLWVVALAVWLRTRRILWVAGLLIVAVISPAMVGAAASALPADCTAAQKSQYGDRGCGRDLEMRLEG
jgi:hypothetical protein